MPSACAIAIIEAVSVCCSSLVSMPAMKLRSILMRLTMKRRRFAIEAWPVPKSSSSTWKPAEARPRRLRTTMSASLLISTVSSTSMAMRDGLDVEALGLPLDLLDQPRVAQLRQREVDADARHREARPRPRP